MRRKKNYAEEIEGLFVNVKERFLYTLFTNGAMQR
jgi:hypothetical protein